MKTTDRWEVPLFEPNYDEREVNAVASVVRRRWLTMGEVTGKFEARFASLLENRAECVALSSCTAALHVALLALGIRPGDEVIVPALTFVAAANVVKAVGAEPVFADSASLDDWNVDADEVRKRLTDKTRAVIVVHYAGYPCAVKAVRRVCNEEGIHLIEDVAHAPGGRHASKPLGTFGTFGCFSFFSNKNLSVGEGGMIATPNPDLAERARYLRSHGMTTLTLDRHLGRAFSYDVVQAGFNYRIDEMRAALGLIQLTKLLAGNEERRRLIKLYRRLLNTIKEVVLPFSEVRDGDLPTGHILPCLLSRSVNRLALMRRMQTKGVQTSIHYPSFGDFSAYSGVNKNELPIASAISAREITLPLFPDMGSAKVSYVVNALQASLQEIRESA